MLAAYCLLLLRILQYPSNSVKNIVRNALPLFFFFFLHWQTQQREQFSVTGAKVLDVFSINPKNKSKITLSPLWQPWIACFLTPPPPIPAHTSGLISPPKAGNHNHICVSLILKGKKKKTILQTV